MLVLRGFDLLRKHHVSLFIGDFRAACSRSRVGFCTTPADGEDPGAGRMVAKRVQRVSSPGGRLDRIGIG